MKKRYVIRTTLILPLLLFCGTAFLTACSGTALQNDFFTGQEVNLAESSYGAADMLSQQSRSFVTPETPLQIGRLSDMRAPQDMTAFGRIVASHVGSRFVQLGYNVVTAMPVPVTVPGQEASTGTGQAAPPGGAMITGQYAIARRDIIINLQVVDGQSGRLLAAYDYSVPMTADVKALLDNAEK